MPIVVLNVVHGLHNVQLHPIGPFDMRFEFVDELFKCWDIFPILKFLRLRLGLRSNHDRNFFTFNFRAFIRGNFYPIWCSNPMVRLFRFWLFNRFARFRILLGCCFDTQPKLIVRLNLEYKRLCLHFVSSQIPI